MTSDQLRALQAAILATPDAQPHIHTNEMPKISAEEAMVKDQAVADAINASGFGARTIEVEAWRAKRFFVKRLKWRAIEAAAISHPVPQIKAACQVAVDLANDARMMADFADPSAAPMWDALVAAAPQQLCTEAERDEIVGWCRAAPAWTAAQCGLAIRGPWGDEK